MRDAIVYGYDWDGASTVERIALALARVGGRVLHCDSARSVWKRPDANIRQLEANLYTFRPWLFASRLNRRRGIARIQGKIIARQILKNAKRLGLNKPIFIYAPMGRMVLPICQTMKDQGLRLVYVYANHLQGMEQAHVGLSDLTIVVPRPAYQRLRDRWGSKIHHVPHGVDLRPFRALDVCPERPSPLLAGIPRPRLGYAGGNAFEHLDTRALRELLERRPEWNFISFEWNPGGSGRTPAVPLPNAHVLPWQAPEGFARCVASFDVGFMPYDCSNEALYNGPPMKLWDYFALGLPVVATPLVHLWEYKDLVYLGNTAKELERGVDSALAEPTDSPLRAKRKKLAEEHSIETLGRLLNGIFD